MFKKRGFVQQKVGEIVLLLHNDSLYTADVLRQILVNMTIPQSNSDVNDVPKF